MLIGARATTGYQRARDTIWLHDTRGLNSPAMTALAPVYLRGDYAGVLRIVRPLAESGDGVPRDVVEGYAWMSVGLKNLEPGVDPRKFRAELGYFSKTKMTPGHLAEGERRAQAWEPGDKCRDRG
jgi:hypothetical protein